MKLFGKILFLSAVQSCQHHVTKQAKQVMKRADKPMTKIQHSRKPKGTIDHNALEMTCTVLSCTACMDKARYGIKQTSNIHQIHCDMMFHCCYTKAMTLTIVKKSVWNKYSLGWHRRPVLSILLD